MSAAGPPQGANSAPVGGQRSGDSRKRGGTPMNSASEATAPRKGTDARNRRLLVLIAAIAVAPVLLSYAMYYFLPRDARANYGTLLATRPLPPIAGTQLNGAPFATGDLRGRWIMLFVASGDCDPRCGHALYASRQARTIQNAERERVQRAWLIPDDRAPAPGILAEHPDLLAARIAPSAGTGWPEGVDRIYLIDPLGNFVLAWPSNPDIKAMARDLTRLLRASRIG